jgi:hypothetical protein
MSKLQAETTRSTGPGSISTSCTVQEGQMVSARFALQDSTFDVLIPLSVLPPRGHMYKAHIRTEDDFIHFETENRGHQVLAYRHRDGTWIIHYGCVAYSLELFRQSQDNLLMEHAASCDDHETENMEECCTECESYMYDETEDFESALEAIDAHMERTKQPQYVAFREKTLLQVSRYLGYGRVKTSYIVKGQPLQAIWGIETSTLDVIIELPGRSFKFNEAHLRSQADILSGKTSNKGHLWCAYRRHDGSTWLDYGCEGMPLDIFIKREEELLRRHSRLCDTDCLDTDCLDCEAYYNEEQSDLGHTLGIVQEKLNGL